MRPIRTLLTALLVAVVLLPTTVPVGATSPDRAAPRLGPNPITMEPRYFPETGHYISGRFRQYWEEYGGVTTFGYPLTRPFDDLLLGNQTRTVQYFERARFEYDQGRAQPYDVQLTLIGAEITAARRTETPFLPAAPRAAAGTSYAAPTGHNLGGAFRRWWDGNGGLERFGYPLSEEFRGISASDGREYTTQYFERARFEYHPEHAGTPDEVQLGQLGRERLVRDGVAPDRVAPEIGPPGGAERPGFFFPPFPLIAGHGELGANVYLNGAQNPAAAAYNARAAGALSDAGLGWARFQLVWRDFEQRPGAYDWLPLDTRIAAARAAGARIVLTIVKPPAWASPPGRPGGYSENTTPLYNMLTEVAAHYQGQVRAYEIGNEPNLASEVGGEVSVAGFFDFLKAGYLAIKRTDPTAIVVLGGLLATTTEDPSMAVSAPTFLRQLYGYQEGQVARYFDVLGFHPAGTANPPEAHFPERPGSGACPPGLGGAGPCYRDAPGVYFRQVEDLRVIMEAHGEWAKQIWLTEFGWDSCIGQAAPAGYEYCQLVSEEQQADYTVRAVAYAREHWPWVGVMLLWNLNYVGLDFSSQGLRMTSATPNLSILPGAGCEGNLRTLRRGL
jgi:hypothetical protein